jgi:hypothetical protein
LFDELRDDTVTPDQERKLLGKVVTRGDAGRHLRLLPLLAHRHGSDEAVALPLASLDEPPAVPPVAERPPKGGDLEFQIPFHDVDIGPDTSEQLGLSDPFARSFDQGEKDVEGAASDANGSTCLQQKTSAGQDLEAVERERGFDGGRMRLCHCNLARKVSPRRA